MLYGVGSVPFTGARTTPVMPSRFDTSPPDCQRGTSHRGFLQFRECKSCTMQYRTSALLVSLAIGANALAPANVLTRRGMAQAAGAGVAALVAPQVANAKGKAAMPPPAPKSSKKAASKKDSKAAAAPSGVDLIKTLFVRAGVRETIREEQQYAVEQPSRSRHRADVALLLYRANVAFTPSSRRRVSTPSSISRIPAQDGSVPAGGIVAWYEKNLAKDFTADFAGGKVVFDRKQYIGLTKDILASVPDFTYTSPKHDFKKKGKNQVAWTAVVKGTHTGKPFSPIKGVPPAKPNKKAPAKLQNDPEVPRTVNGTGHTGPSEFCATSI